MYEFKSTKRNIVGILAFYLPKCIHKDEIDFTNMRLIYTFSLCILTGASIFAQNHNPVLTGMSGQTLLDELVNQYKPTTVFSYADARDTLYGKIDRINDSLECVYTGYKVYIPPTGDASTAAFSQGINTEHSFPQAFGAGSGNARSDMHHLFPSREEANTARGNDQYADIADNATQTWFYLDQEQSSIPPASIRDLYSEDRSGSNGLFEPRESKKGDIARAIFYFYTMYKAEADAESATFFSDQVATLCNWHEQDPVDQVEWNRTWGIAQRQDGKPNPFVLDCSLVARAYCGGTIDAACMAVSNEEVQEEPNDFDIVPNPSKDYIMINNLEESSDYRITSVTGQVLMSGLVVPGQKISLGSLPKGIYILTLERGNNRVSKKFICR